MNGLKDCHVPTRRPALKTFPVIEIFLVLCVLSLASLPCRVTKAAYFLCLLVKAKCESFFSVQYDHPQQSSKRRLVELLFTCLPSRVSCLVSNLRHIEPALTNHFTNSCPSSLPNYLEREIDPSK